MKKLPEIRRKRKTNVTIVLQNNRQIVIRWFVDTGFDIHHDFKMHMCQTTNLGWSWSSSKRDVMQQRLI